MLETCKNGYQFGPFTADTEDKRSAITMAVNLAVVYIMGPCSKHEESEV